jgi:hypothetical protein
MCGSGCAYRGKQVALIGCYDCGKQISSAAPVCPGCGAPAKQSPEPQRLQVDMSHTLPIKSNKFWFAIACTGLIALYIWSLDTKDSGISEKRNVAFERSLVLREVELRSEEKVDKYRTLKVDLYIANPTKYKIKNMRVECIDKSKTYSELKANRAMVYEFLNAAEKITLRNVDFGFAHPQRSFTTCRLIAFDFND